MTNKPYFLSKDHSQAYTPTRLIDLGKNEEFLENFILDDFEVLGLESYESGIRGPFKCWQQVTLHTPEGRIIYPDIVAISESGHFIVVEVKLGSNKELKSRQVISQIIDYASSFAAYSTNDLIDALSDSGSDTTNWEEFIGGLFPNCSDKSGLANVLERRISNGEINLVVAADYSPVGTKDLLKGIASQQTIGFKLDLVVIRPYVSADESSDDILFVPEREITTEIIARTAITISYKAGESQPAHDVTTSSIEDIEEKLANTKAGGSLGKVWTVEEVKESFRTSGHEIYEKLWELCETHSDQGKLVAKGKRKNARFGFHVQTPTDDGKQKSLLAFACTLGWNDIYVYPRWESELRLGAKLNAEYISKLENIIGEVIKPERKEIAVSWDLVADKFDEFAALMKWLSEKLSAKMTSV